eukprot:TRINITY_DN29006_c0_g1_i1.p1 TRINITY_DN29006_c0_g1~~TRINITY_DN29006_c0_g1_i1.p1  ORF type:complete len:450 (+),score=42.38 TRINITY_DN29006_c0_g1_i1:67-1350(+)
MARSQSDPCIACAEGFPLAPQVTSSVGKRAQLRARSAPLERARHTARRDLAPSLKAKANDIRLIVRTVGRHCSMPLQQSGGCLVEASGSDTVNHVLDEIALKLGVPSYRITASTESGVLLQGKLSLSSLGVFDETTIWVAIGEVNQWLEVPREQFIEHVVAAQLATRDVLNASALCTRPASIAEAEFRHKYIPGLRAFRQRQQRRQLAQASISSQVHGDVAKENLDNAIRLLRSHVANAEVAVAAKARECEAMKQQMATQVSRAIPALEAAITSIGRLDHERVYEATMYSKTLAPVALVGETICIMFQHRPSWDNTKKLFQDPKLRSMMLDYDKDNIPAIVIEKLEPYMQREDFHPEILRPCSFVAADMCTWVRALYTHSPIAKEVERLNQSLLEAVEDLLDAMFQLDLWRTHLQQHVDRESIARER